MLTLIIAVSIGLSMATTAMVARRVGEGDLEGAAVTAVLAVGDHRHAGLPSWTLEREACLIWYQALVIG